MSRNPPSLLYLTIYNPALRPDPSVIYDNDEDAEEQAQILFYTSSDRAVSRDKMLRQVGLAKALVNFAEIFHSIDPCQNVHSQSRRMLTLSPEPNFWMHVTIELAKTPRAPSAKPKNREKAGGKAKEAEPSQTPQIEYHEGTLHDSAVRAHLMRGYEQFKLTHGSFSSILSSLGQQALELQLERFFTVWAWTWDLDKGFSLGTDLGLPLHPLYQLILPAIDNFSSQIPEGDAVLVLTQSHVAPSSKYRSSQYPVALARHLLNHLTPTSGPATLTASMSRPDTDSTSYRDHNDRRTLPNTDPPSSGGFLGVSMSMTMSAMNVRKWTWPSFGKGHNPKGPVTDTEDVVPDAASGHAEVQVDQNALQDAMTTDNTFGAPMEKPPATDDGPEKDAVEQSSDSSELDTPRPSRVLPPMLDSSTASLNGLLPDVDSSLVVDGENPRFTWTDVFLAPSHDSLATSRRKVCLVKHGQYGVALLNHDADDVEAWLEPILRLFEDLKVISEDNRHDMASSLPSATKILQPKDNYVLKTGDYVNSSGEALDSDHLFEAGGLLDREPAVVEIFSRGLHPQHWHVASRVADLVDDEKGDAYLEVSRKEATLSDVDNILRGLYKTHV